MLLVHNNNNIMITHFREFVCTGTYQFKCSSCHTRSICTGPTRANVATIDGLVFFGTYYMTYYTYYTTYYMSHFE